MVLKHRLEVRIWTTATIIENGRTMQLHPLIGERARTGTYRFRTGFYGLADMAAEFQQAVNRVLIGTNGTHAFIEN